MREVRTALLLADDDRARWEQRLQGEPLVDRVYRLLRLFFDEVHVVTPEPRLLAGRGHRAIPDEHPGAGILGALATGLRRCAGEHAFAAAADMPLLHLRVVRHLYAQRRGWDVVVPRTRAGLEPVCAVYSRACAAAMEERIARGELKVLDFISEVRTRIVDEEELRALDPSGLAFRNVHSPADLDECRLHLARVRSCGPPAVSFVARSGTGKTTLLERVIAELTRRGYRLGTIKHDAHRFEIDHEGKDSWRLTRAGASPMVISSAERLAMVSTNRGGELPLEELIQRYMAEADLVVTEGYRTAGLPRVEVHRAGAGAELLCAPRGGFRDPRLIALASDEPLSVPVPVFPLDDPAPLCDFLEGRFLSGA